MATIFRCSTLFCALLAGCSASKEAKRVELPVSTDGEGLEAVTTDLGYAVELTRAAVVANDLRFAIAGEAHSSLLRQISDALVPVAHAHPGHYQGGEVTGELPGHFVLSFVPGESESHGTATLLVGQYHSMNLTLAHASDDDVPNDDPLLGHSAVLLGTASRGGVAIHFQVAIDSPVARDIVGIPFDHEVAEDAPGDLVVRMRLLDPLENDTLFDGVDFGLLDKDTDGEVAIAPNATDGDTTFAYNLLRRSLQTHDHFVVEHETP